MSCGLGASYAIHEPLKRSNANSPDAFPGCLREDVIALCDEFGSPSFGCH